MTAPRFGLVLGRRDLAVDRGLLSPTGRPLTLVTLLMALQSFSLALIGQTFAAIGALLAMVSEFLALLRDPIALVRHPLALGHRTLTLLQPRHALSLRSRIIRGQLRRAPLDLHSAMLDLRAASLTAISSTVGGSDG